MWLFYGTARRNGTPTLDFFFSLPPPGKFSTVQSVPPVPTGVQTPLIVYMCGAESSIKGTEAGTHSSKWLRTCPIFGYLFRDKG